MKTLILCDRESRSYDGLDLPYLVQKAVREAGSEANIIVLNGDEIKPCVGCFQCWVKTPGLCVITNDCANTVAGEEIRSDALIILSKVCYGGYSYDIKSFLDRSTTNLSPYLEVVKGEMRHKKRYERFPLMIFFGYGFCTAQERETFISLADRNALNMRPPRHFVFTAQDQQEAIEVIESLKDALAWEVAQ